MTYRNYNSNDKENYKMLANMDRRS